MGIAGNSGDSGHIIGSMGFHGIEFVWEEFLVIGIQCWIFITIDLLNQ